MRFFEVFANEQYRELLGQLTARELAQRYKQSVIGYFWVILNPFIQMLVMSFVFVNIFGNKNLGVAYPLFLFTGLLPWNLFSQSLTSCAEALVGSASLLSKIYFPREILVLSRMLARGDSACFVGSADFCDPIFIYLWFEFVFSRRQFILSRCPSFTQFSGNDLDVFDTSDV